mmetsp:Transcript_9745/g.29328  ORF Transcript_9745/g.29328 Transcript_9745/m.29328 type:complete len:238 (+) Transcript_9745:1321-2034(+)
MCQVAPHEAVCRPRRDLHLGYVGSLGRKLRLKVRLDVVFERLPPKVHFDALVGAVQTHCGDEARRTNIAVCHAQHLAVLREGQLPLLQVQAGADDVSCGEAGPVRLPVVLLVKLLAVVAVVPVAAQLPPRLATNVEVGGCEANGNAPAVAGIQHSHLVVVQPPQKGHLAVGLDAAHVVIVPARASVLNDQFGLLHVQKLVRGARVQLERLGLIPIHPGLSRHGSAERSVSLSAARNL